MTIPLLLAAQDGHLECVRILLDKDADLNQYNEKILDCESPLKAAFQNGHTECVQILLAKMKAVYEQRTERFNHFSPRKFSWGYR